MPISHALEASHRETTGVEMNSLFPTLSNTLFAKRILFPAGFSLVVASFLMVLAEYLVEGEDRDN